jgi:hypothetical protein
MHEAELVDHSALMTSRLNDSKPSEQLLEQPLVAQQIQRFSTLRNSRN